MKNPDNTFSKWNNSMFGHFFNWKFIWKFQGPIWGFFNSLNGFLHIGMPDLLTRYLSTVVFLCWPEAIIPEFSKCCWGSMEAVSCIDYCSGENMVNPNALPHFEIFCEVQIKSGSSILDSIILWAFMVCIVLGFTSGAFSTEYMNSILYFVPLINVTCGT